MGSLCSCCFRASEDSLVTPDAESRRIQQAQAAERRIAESESRGF